MLRIDIGREPAEYCDGMSRRSFVQIGIAGMASIGLGDVLRAKALSGQAKKNTSVLMLWLDGGPGHMDMYDMKPDAPKEYRGLWRPIPTNVSGIEVSELFPRQAQLADKFSLVRSLHHNIGAHFPAAHYFLTGRHRSAPGLVGTFPSMGSITTMVTGARRSGLPPYIGVPISSSIGRKPGYFGGNFLGMHRDPFQTAGDPNSEEFQVNNINLPSGLSVDRLEDRRFLHERLDQLRRDVDRSGTFEALDEFDRQAYDLVAGSAARRAFDISAEDPRIRDLYGRHTWGQSTLLARRLVEAGSTFVTVHFGGWDHHWNLEGGMKNHLPKVDSAVATLIEDLDQRGLLEKTLVIVCGEFSRTPRMNTGHNGRGTPGRDHWGRSMSVLMAGGGVKGGRVVGSTNRLGEAPKDHPLVIGDLHTTIYDVLGVDPRMMLLDHSGRPVHAVERGEVIHELF